MSSKKSKSPTPASTERLRQQAIAEIQERIDAQEAAAPASEALASHAAPDAAQVPEVAATAPTNGGPDAPAAPAKGKRKGGGKAKGAKAPAAKPAKAPKAPKAPKEKKPAQPKRVSLLDAAFTVLAGAKEPMSAKEIVADVLNCKMWSTKGETPEATLYAAMIREIAAKKGAARFVKVDRGRFAAGKGA